MRIIFPTLNLFNDFPIDLRIQSKVLNIAWQPLHNRAPFSCPLTFNPVLLAFIHFPEHTRVFPPAAFSIHAVTPAWATQNPGNNLLVCFLLILQGYVQMCFLRKAPPGLQVK